MLNIEKYKDDILNAEIGNITCCVYDDILHLDCIGNCVECKKNVMKWLLSEYKEPILDDVEKEYLSAVIKPFREKVSYISKLEKAYPETDQFIKITLINGEYVCLPYFTRKSRMYIGMKQWRHYTLQELGL